MTLLNKYGMKRYRIILADGMIITGIRASRLIEGGAGFYLYQEDFLVGFVPKTAVLLWDNSEK